MTGKDLGVHQEICSLYNTQNTQTSQLPKPTQLLPFPHPSQGLHYNLHPFPVQPCPPPSQLWSCAAQVFQGFAHFCPGCKKLQHKLNKRCTSGLAYLQLGHILLIVDLQWLPLVFLLLQLAVTVCQFFHQSCILRAQFVQLCRVPVAHTQTQVKQKCSVKELWLGVIDQAQQLKTCWAGYLQVHLCHRGNECELSF